MIESSLNNRTKRVTVMFDPDLLKKLREMQAKKKIKKSNQSVNSSVVANDVLRKSLTKQ